MSDPHASNPSHTLSHNHNTPSHEPSIFDRHLQPLSPRPTPGHSPKSPAAPASTPAAHTPRATPTPHAPHTPHTPHTAHTAHHPRAASNAPAHTSAHTALHATAPAAHHADSFAALGLTPTLLRALADEGYTTPTPIQAKAIPTVLSGKDVLGCAQTGTGKTAAFALPILQRLTADHHATTPGRAPRALVLSPTRELATQIGDSFATYGRHTGIRHTVIFGGVGQNPQVQALHRGVDVLVATPGRLIDLLEQRLVNLSAVRILILDEADRMLDMGFIQPIRRIVASLPKNHPRQTLLFSATMPKEIMHLADSLLKDPVKVAVTPVASAAPLIEQKLYHVNRADKPALLGHLIEAAAVARAVVFTKTKHGADKLCRKLHAAGIPSVAIHGNKAQNQRTRALDAFKAGRVRVLVATDVAARGLDVDGITHVFNFDMPMEPEAYVHRIGRTGRAGASGLAISFCDQDERDLLRQVERLTAKRIPTSPLPAPLPPLPAKHAPLDQTHPTFDHPASHSGRGHRGHAPRGNSRGNARRDDHAGQGHRAHGAGHGSAHGDAPRSGGSRPPGAPKPGWMHASRGGPRRGR